MNLRSTLTQYLIEQRRRYPQASGSFNNLMLDVALACKAIAREVAFGRLAELPPSQGHAPTTLDDQAKQTFLRMTTGNGHVAALLADHESEPWQAPEAPSHGRYLLVCDPLDGTRNMDVNMTLGSIFSVLRAPDDASGQLISTPDFLQAGTQQVAAGYAFYGPSTMLVLSVGHGVAGFTLDPNLGEFMLTHPDIQIPPDTQEFAINASNSRFWEPPIKRYVDECLAGKTGPRGKDFNMRWIASTVAEAHRILMRGGVFMYPRDNKEPVHNGPARHLGLLHEANPIGFLIEQAGGRVSTGQQASLVLQPQALDQRIGLVFGSRHEVERLERYHAEPQPLNWHNPLFAERSLFMD